MGTVYSKITLKNAADVVKTRDGFIPPEKVRALTVQALVDTGTGTLVISEEVQQQLGLVIEGLRQATLADGVSTSYPLTEPVEIRWEDRYTICRALVVPGADQILLGVIPLEDMDLMVDPTRQELTGVHGREALYLLV
jgi:clan AA aspartic protease